jgi:hypothetical protein
VARDKLEARAAVEAIPRQTKRGEVEQQIRGMQAALVQPQLHLVAAVVVVARDKRVEMQQLGAMAMAVAVATVLPRQLPER